MNWITIVTASPRVTGDANMMFTASPPVTGDAETTDAAFADAAQRNIAR